MEDSTRREFLYSGASAGALGLTGCLRLGSSGDSETVSTETRLTEAPTSTPPETPTDAPTGTPERVAGDFLFSYIPNGGSGNGAVTITCDSGNRLVAEQIQILSSDGDSSRWHELSSTSARGKDKVTQGAQAVVSGTVVGWNSDILPDETVRVIYHYSDGSTVKLASFSPEPRNETPSDGVYESFKHTKQVAVTLANGTPVVRKVQPLYLTNGDGSKTGTGAIEVDLDVIQGPSDIAVFTQDGSLLNYEIEFLNDSSGVLWVYNDWRRDGTAQAQIAYGDGETDNQVNSSTLWGQEVGIRMRYNLSESGSQAVDSTSYDHSSVSTEGTYQANGQFGQARGFDGVNDMLEPPEGIISSVTDTTYSIWVKPDQFNERSSVFDLRGDLYLQFEILEDGRIGAYTYDGSTSYKAVSDTVVNEGEWYYIAHRYDHSDSGQTLFIDGEIEDSTSGHNQTMDLDQRSNIMANGGGPSGYNARSTQGIADQAVVYQGYKSDSWMQAEFDASRKAGQVFFTQEAAQPLS